ncbi:DUF6314 family protein [Paractinoplanes atraurantiacus]|uniref:DUF6314 domain-containing protein n=1 Tax=Paractinoplanes atraurantiacus TaxID=1036182 RepID=A0A285IGQ7_9ACTN|nr:DUF6314 family protein [Actinoplanes atraurantiacus]SNY47122.1 hypothetical protein SAMN05421748_10871 [Actinoplanes atraurantiacus]
MHRRILDHRAGVEGSFVGTAEFGDDLSYEEQGDLTYGDHRGPATRSLRYHDRGDRRLEVTFADGRPFYLLDLGEGESGDAWSAEHPCAADTYVVAGRITGPDSYTEHWHATGPAKDYELITSYDRSG